MLNEFATDSRRVLVELSIIPIGSNGQVNDQIAKMLSIFEKAGLFHEDTSKGTTVEGEWGEISPLIYDCYQRVQEQFPQGFLKVSIR